MCLSQSQRAVQFTKEQPWTTIRLCVKAFDKQKNYFYLPDVHGVGTIHSAVSGHSLSSDPNQNFEYTTTQRNARQKKIINTSEVPTYTERKNNWFSQGPESLTD